MGLHPLLRIGLLLLLALTLSMGCNRKARKAAGTTAATTSSGGSVVVQPGAGPGVMQVRKAAERPGNLNDLSQIALAYRQYQDTYNRPPANAQELLSFLQVSGKLGKLLQEGVYVVYWNANLNTLPAGPSNTILAYTRETPTEDGMVVMADGTARRMTAQEFAATPKAGR